MAVHRKKTQPGAPGYDNGATETTIDSRRLKIEYWPLDRFKPYEKNPRKNDAVLSRIVASISEFGFAIPILAHSSGEIVDGHLRYKGAQKLNMAEAPVIVCDGWTEVQRKQFRLLANRSVGWAAWDADLLASEFADLKDLDTDLSLTGFDPAEIESYLAGQPDPEEDDEPGDGDSGKLKSIKLTEAQFETVLSAIAKLRSMEGATEKTLKDGRALELIAADWMS